MGINFPRLIILELLSLISFILGHFSIYACHPCAGAMLIFSVSFQFVIFK